MGRFIFVSVNVGRGFFFLFVAVFLSLRGGFLWRTEWALSWGMGGRQG